MGELKYLGCSYICTNSSLGLAGVPHPPSYRNLQVQKQNLANGKKKKERINKNVLRGKKAGQSSPGKELKEQNKSDKWKAGFHTNLVSLRNKVN